MDIVDKNASGISIEDELEKSHVRNTITEISNRVLDTSFAAAYYPDVIVKDPRTLTNVLAPPSVAVLGAFSLNDSIGHPWFAPAGFTRGALRNTIETQVKLNRANLDALLKPPHKKAHNEDISDGTARKSILPR